MDAQVEADFRALVIRHTRFVFRVTYALLRNTHDAEDAVQETFLRLYRNRGWQAAEDERAFLARVAWRVSVDLLRGRRPSESVDEGKLDFPSSNPSPEQLALTGDFAGRLHNLMDSLPEELRQPLALSSIEELNSRQIAAILAIPEGTVRTRLQRARAMLKMKLAAAMGAKGVRA